MNIKKIKELIDLMNEDDLTEIEIEKEGTKIKLAKNGSHIIEQAVTASVPGALIAPNQTSPANGQTVCESSTLPP